jgi:transposase
MWTQRAAEEAVALLVPVRELAGRGELDAAFTAMQELLTEQALEIQRLKMLERLAKRLRFGRASEKLSAEELGQAYLAFGGEPAADGTLPAEPAVPTPDIAATEFEESGGEEVAAQSGTENPAPEKPHGGGGRRPLPADLVRIETLIRVPDEERACVLCGRERTCVGHSECVRLEYVPGHVEVHVETREKIACLPCRKDMGVAPREEPKRKVRAAPSLLSELLVLKCDDALPLHRVREQFQRIGLDIPKSTLGRWWDYVTSLLGPVADAIMGRILANEYIGVDDTGLLYLDPTDHGKKRPAAKGHLWCFVDQTSLVGFRFTRTWQADEIATHLTLAARYVQGDGYAGYGSEVAIGSEFRSLVLDEFRLGCMMHARRPFHELVAAKDTRASGALILFQKIYALEQDYRTRGLDHATRGSERQERSLPLFNALSKWVAQIHPRLRPKDPLAKATAYFTNQEPFLRRCFSDGRFEIDTGRVERAIREVALGRKNFVLTGSAAAGARLATAYTVVESARRILGTERTRAYLNDVITRLEAGCLLQDLPSLVPDVWLADQSAE